MLKAALWLAALPLLASASGLQSVTGSNAHPIASVGIIIDDLGNSLRYGQRAPSCHIPTFPYDSPRWHAPITKK
jgi:hypothetical protein